MSLGPKRATIPRTPDLILNPAFVQYETDTSFGSLVSRTKIVIKFAEDNGATLQIQRRQVL